MKIEKTLRNGLSHSHGLWLATLIVSLLSSKLQALTIISDPEFTPSTKAPLAGVLTLQTDVNSFVSVSVNDGTNTWTHDFYDFTKNHAETLLGFKPNRFSEISVTVRDQFRNTYTSSKRPIFYTAPLPAFMPPVILVTNNPAMMEPGYTIFRVNNQTNGESSITIVDNFGQVVWFAQSTLAGGGMGPVPTPTDIRQLPNGNLFFPETSRGGFGECDMLGNSFTAFGAAPSYPIDAHEDLLTDHGTILYISTTIESITNFPSSATDPDAPTEFVNVNVEQVVEVSTNKTTAYTAWSLIDMLDPTRIDYLCFAYLSMFGIDPEHANALIDSPADNSIIVSLRNQDAIVKFSRSGQLKWILGPHENWGPEFQKYLLTPVGTPFTWNYGQHAPVFTPQGTILFFDDGNCRAEPFETPVADQDNYSRAAEFSVDETNMTVSQVWEFTGTNSPGGYSDRLYCGLVGNASWLPQTGNVLVTYGAVSYENGSHPSAIATNAEMVRIKEVTHDANPTIVFDIELFDPGTTNVNYNGYNTYRSYRIPDLYPHQAVPVQVLTVQDNSGEPLLQFTANPMRNYVVQSSEDLINWTTLGAPDSDDADGDFSFSDESQDGLTAEYYRVITQ